MTEKVISCDKSIVFILTPNHCCIHFSVLVWNIPQLCVQCVLHMLCSVCCVCYMCHVVCVTYVMLCVACVTCVMLCVVDGSGQNLQIERVPASTDQPTPGDE